VFDTPKPPSRDPRTYPATGDRVLLRSEGTERVVIEVTTAAVTWRYAGGSARRTDTHRVWAQDTVLAQIVSRGSRES